MVVVIRDDNGRQFIFQGPINYKTFLKIRAAIGFRKQAVKCRWTKEDIDFLRKNYHKLSKSEIAKRLGRGITKNAVISKWHRHLKYETELARV